jgi:hypothetical protein
MELCYSSLNEAIKKFQIELEKYDSNIIRYYIASEMFLEILDCVNYLHEHTPKITLQSLNLSSFVVTFENYGRFVKLKDFIGSNGVEDYEKSNIYSLGLIAQDIFNSFDR